MNIQTKLELVSDPNQMTYEELYGFLWKRLAEAEGHRPNNYTRTHRRDASIELMEKIADFIYSVNQPVQATRIEKEFQISLNYAFALCDRLVGQDRISKTKIAGFNHYGPIRD